MMATDWAERVALFSRSPSSFLSGTPVDVFLLELLRELRDDRAGLGVKILLLTPLCEQPALLCPSEAVGEETALELMSVFAQCPPKSVQLQSHLLLALTSVLICTSCTSSSSRASQDFVDLLLQIIQDSGDLCGDHNMYSVRVTACDCLRELEACCPGILSQRLEPLAGLRQRESCRLHQALVGLYALTLRNAVYQLTQETQAGAEHLRALLGANTSVAWEAEQDSAVMGSTEVLFSLLRGPMGLVPTLQTGADCKELRSVLSSLLEESYLLTPLCQAALLHRLTEVVAMVPGVSPALFRAQLLRLLGTDQVSLLHSTLLLKSAFTDSLFSAEDEAFFLRRLVVLSQHPLLPSFHKLFYINCLLHFPENRPISFSDDSLPVLLTPQLASVLVPTVFNDSATLLARINLLCLVYLEEGEDGEETPGLAFLYQLLASMLLMVESGASRETIVTFFRASFLFLSYFQHVEQCSSGLKQLLCQLYMQHPQLAPHLINLMDQFQDRLAESNWAVGLLMALQEVIVKAPPTQLSLKALRSHLKVLSRVAEEEGIMQQKTLTFLFNVVRPMAPSLGARDNWRLGNAVLEVCRRLLVHPSLDFLLVALGDILHHMTHHYRDTDIQDHARLYYALLTTLSREKLAGVLVQGVTDGGRQVKKQTLCCLMTESEGLTSALSIHHAEREIIRLSELEPERHEPREDDGAVDVASATETYQAQFIDPSFASTILLNYQLCHVDAPSPGFDCLFSIRLHFRRSDQYYEDLRDISIPCVFRERPVPRVQLSLRPRQPLPTTLHVSALFATEDGLTWHVDLPDLYVTFQQTFLPLPAPTAWGRGVRLKVFEGLWEEFEGSGGVLSLFCCQLKEAALKALMMKHFLPFLLPDPSHQEEFRVLLFLSPRSHLLLRVKSEEDAVHFHIATDNSQLLPYLNSYLRSITSSQEGALS